MPDFVVLIIIIIAYLCNAVHVIEAAAAAHAPAPLGLPNFLCFLFILFIFIFLGRALNAAQKVMD